MSYHPCALSSDRPQRPLQSGSNEAFPDDLTGERVLFRVGVDRQTGTPTVLVQSALEPHWGFLSEDAGYLLDSEDSNPDWRCFEPQSAPGRVRVTIEPLSKPDEEPREDIMVVLERIWARQDARSHQPRTAAEVDAEIYAMRDGSDERMEEIEALQEELARQRTTSP